ncbi:hypothetical protein OJF2_07910 [Aquisphaera giovannonii]|uniref:Uncharacterized protein n=1 Tax=Aquisphaera giovannonii TaxID=406548 RepID=A0A5B9VWS2_9BACT|nr:hypothetical protein [Aquisphaera giovannonii]QEH32321.1 hypothetical protein OJF2_07910 [Aquisphaera giovannonii]
MEAVAEDIEVDRKLRALAEDDANHRAGDGGGPRPLHQPDT